MPHLLFWKVLSTTNNTDRCSNRTMPSSAIIGLEFGLNRVRKIVCIYSSVELHSLNLLVNVSAGSFFIEEPDRAVFLMPKLLRCLAEILCPLVHSPIILIQIKWAPHTSPHLGRLASGMNNILEPWLGQISFILKLFSEVLRRVQVIKLNLNLF